jgi:hypothetical protein
MDKKTKRTVSSQIENINKKIDNIKRKQKEIMELKITEVKTNH